MNNKQVNGNQLLENRVLKAQTAVFLFTHAQPVKAAVNCADATWPVANQADVNAAIACYNAKASSGSYTISLTQDIALAVSTTTISNAVVGVSLDIE